MPHIIPDRRRFNTAWAKPHDRDTVKSHDKYGHHMTKLMGKYTEGSAAYGYLTH